MSILNTYYVARVYGSFSLLVQHDRRFLENELSQEILSTFGWCRAM